MKQKLVSIIVPVYNCEEYVEECIRSIINQTYDSIEVLIIDDGSTDDSINRCKQYAQKDIRIRIHRKKNEGVSSARNKGILLAKGEYICFVDADDYLENEYVEQLVKGLKNADLSICGYSRVCENEVTKYYIDNVSGHINEEEVIRLSLCSPKITASCWNKMFKRQIISENGLLFRDDITIGEDMLFYLQYLKKCKALNYIPISLYNYRKNRNSAIQSGYTEETFDQRKISVLVMLNEIEKISFYYQNASISFCFAYRKVRSSIWLLLQMAYGNFMDDDVLRAIQKNCGQGLKNWKFFQGIGSASERLIALVISVMPHMSYKIINIIIKKYPKVVQKFLT